MGGNPANPDVNVLSDTTNEGLEPEHANAVTVVTEEDAAAVSVGAQNALQIYENQLAILKGDMAQVTQENREGRALVKKWRETLGIGESEDPDAKITEIREQNDALSRRLGQFQIALGVGPGDDPERAAGALKSRNRLADVDPTSQLPAYGHLLLMTALAKVSTLLQSSYYNTPNQIKTPEGDTWLSRVEETLDDEGNPIRLIVVRHEPGSYAYQEARVQKSKLESDLASAIREGRTADRHLDPNKGAKDPGIRKTALSDKQKAAERVDEIKKQLDSIEPKTIEPEAKEWRFNADLAGYALKAAE